PGDGVAAAGERLGDLGDGARGALLYGPLRQFDRAGGTGGRTLRRRVEHHAWHALGAEQQPASIDDVDAAAPRRHRDGDGPTAVVAHPDAHPSHGSDRLVDLANLL